jgi:carbon-monoxide dehydrogenase medium subunit
MLLPRFEYHEPATLAQALTLLAKLGPEARLLAGGTDLLVNMKKGVIRPGHVVSLDKILKLRRMQTRNGFLSLGALATAAEIAVWKALKGWAGALKEGAQRLGTPLVRNRATVAGNLVTGRPAADLPPPLLALKAGIRLESAANRREIPLDGFFQGPGQTGIRPDEILTQVLIPIPPPKSGSAYLKLGARQTLEISLVNVAASLTLEGKKGPIREARVVLGAVGPTPLSSPSAQKILIGAIPGEDLFREAGQAAVRDARPIDDFRGTAEYRRWMVEVLTQRALGLAWKRAVTR